MAEVLDRCGIPLEMRPAVPPPITAEVEACLIDAIGEEAMQEVYSGQRAPTTEETEAFIGCQVVGSDVAPSSPQIEFPDFESLPEIGAPMEVGTVVWSISIQDAAALLERLPDQISGHLRAESQGQQDGSQKEIGFGRDLETQQPILAARVQDLAENDAFPADATAADFVASFAEGVDWEVVAVGREGRLGWAHIKTTDTSQGVTRDVYGMIWGDDTSSLVFSAKGNDPAGLTEVVRAMVSAAR